MNIAESVKRIIASFEAARLIDQRANEIASSIEDIVMSLQFHDITRQQIDHVKEVFGHLCDKLEAGNHVIFTRAALVRDILNLQLIALNARIKAAHLGGEGVAIDTISGSIYELYQSAREDTKTLSYAIESLTGLSLGFKEDLRSMQDAQSCIVSIMVDELKRLISLLGDINDQILSALVEMIDLGESLKKEIRYTAEGITVHEEMETLLNEVMSIMDDMKERGLLICSSGQDVVCLPLIAVIDNLYTMKNERDIHEGHIQTVGQETSRHQAASEVDGLVENVELF